MRGRGRGGDGSGAGGSGAGGVNNNEFADSAVVQQGAVNDQQNGDRYFDHSTTNNYVTVVAGDGPAVPAVASAEGPLAVQPPDAWVTLVEQSEVWRHADAAYDSAPLREHAMDAARGLARLRDDCNALLEEDPWRDDGLADRIAYRTNWLFSNVWDRSDMVLSPAEAALLSLLPLLHHVRGLRRAVSLLPIDPVDLHEHSSRGERGRYERFLRKHKRLVRRADKLSVEAPDSGRREIGWWLFHRWAAQDPDLAREPWAPGLLAASGIREGLLGAFLDAQTLARLLTGPRLSPHTLCGIDGQAHLQPPRWVTPGRSKEQPLREQLVGIAFAVAHGLAIEITDLPPTIVQHIGIRRAVGLADLRDTVEKAEWDQRASGKERELRARCRHNAVAAALREHAGHVDALLRAIHRADDHGAWPEELKQLPVYAGAGAVVEIDAYGTDLPPREAVRFRFDESAVQELLVGERLYRDPSLAIRELYQNALDACRYRRARLRAHAQKQGLPADAFRYEGEITFEQGTDEHGRPYLSCTDNGVGMGEEQLTGVFSEAGARFADQSEYLAEQAEWALLPEPVTLHPNSRFGIGVLSYFMLADEIEVSTCRLHKDGKSGRHLTVHITGPGQFFQVKERAPAGAPGTTVTLYLRPENEELSCADTLRRLLGIAEFRVRVGHRDRAEAEETWEPGVFTERRRPSWEKDGIDAYGRLVPWRPASDEDVGGDVVWCEYGGAVLVDGLLAHPAARNGVLAGPDSARSLSGAVVNLRGGSDVRLSVDRTEILNDVSAEVTRLVTKAAEDLVDSGDPLVGFPWIGDVAGKSPALADIVTQATIEAGMRVALPAGDGGPGGEGCFPPDARLGGKRVWRAALSEEKEGLYAVVGGDRPPDHILLWRVLAHRWQADTALLADVVPEVAEAGPVLPALPTDAVLLTAGFHADWVPAGAWGTAPGRILRAAAQIGVSPRRLVERAAALGIPDLRADRFPDTAEPDPTDLALLSGRLDGQTNWLTTKRVVPVAHLLQARARRRIGPAEAARRLADYGFTLPDTSRLPERFTRTDEILLSAELDGVWPWREERDTVLPGSIAAAAVKLNLTTSDVCHRLEALGIPYERAALPERPGRGDVDMLTLIRRPDAGSLDPAEALIPGYLVVLAHTTSTPVAELAARLVELGFSVPPEVPEEGSEPGLQVLSCDVDGQGPWLSHDMPVSTKHLLAAAKATGWPVPSVRSYLLAMGYDVPPLPVEPAEGDWKLLNMLHGGRSAWSTWQDPVSLSTLLNMARDCQRPIREIADRLRELGLDIPDPAETIRTALERVPRA